MESLLPWLPHPYLASSLVSFSDPTLYCSTLQYLSITRPNIAFVVNKVSQSMQDPRNVHWSAVKQILHYLKHTITHGLLIWHCSSSRLAAYTDADCAGCPNDRKSTYNFFFFFLWHNLISSSSKKQPRVSKSSTRQFTMLQRNSFGFYHCFVN